MGFNKIVIIIAILILIGMLTLVGYGMYKSEHDVKFPPVSSDCPDYWTAKDNLCYNSRGLGSCNTGENKSMNFNSDQFKGHDGICHKAHWARNCGVSWNGVTNAGAKLQKVCGMQ